MSTLRAEAMHAGNVATGGAGLGLSHHVNRYLQWVNAAEGQLRNHFVDSRVWTALHSEYFWRIRELRDDSPRPAELIADEARRQAERLDQLADELEQLSAWATSTPGVLAVLDTHVLLHFQPPEQVDWKRVVGADAVRLVLPLRVVEELDEKKYMARRGLADRARRLLTQLRTQAAESDGGPIAVREGVVLDFYVDQEPRRRTLDADQEVLDTCMTIASTGSTMGLVTDDAGMELRARACRIQCFRMPLKYLRRSAMTQEEP